MTVLIVAGCAGTSGDDGAASSTAVTSLPATSTTASNPATTAGPATIPATIPPSVPATAPSTTTPSTTTPSTTTPSTTTPSTTIPSTTTPPSPLVVSAYFVRDEKVATVHRNISHTLATSKAALGELLGGPNAAEAQLGLTSAIPAGTTVDAVSIVDRVALVDLSDEFGSGGGSLSMDLRLAQVVYTLTQFPTVDAVTFMEGDAPVTTFGSEGIELSPGLTRDAFESATPAIFVESPAPFDQVSESVRVFGTSNVFEATFMVRLTDAAGTVVYEHFQMATSGTGTRGTYDFVIPAAMAAPGAAMLRLWEPSSRDGSDTNVIDIPIEL